ncbi:MAG: response regulator [Eubacteriales bacterium]|nr:response regulator [Eubacteriales bacterium]
MRIMIVDDEKYAMKQLCSVVEQVAPGAEIVCINECDDAVEAAKHKNYDVAFLDIQMPEKDGLELAKELKDIYKDINIVFVTGYSQYALDALKIHCSGYVLKPAKKEDIEDALANLRAPIQYNDNKLRVQCFGSFEVFYNNKPVNFDRSKTKELFAYLIDRRGAAATTGELCGILWDEKSADESSKHYLRNLIASLKKSLKVCDAEDVFICKRNYFAVNSEKIECDYYKYLERDAAAVNSYKGEYMAQYSWAEMTLAELEKNR